MLAPHMVIWDKKRVPLLDTSNTAFIEEEKFLLSVIVKEERETSPVVIVSI